MAKKNDIQVIINKKVYTLSGYESEEYLQKIALYLNNKIEECNHVESYKTLGLEYQNILLAINIADDYFKTKEQVSIYEEEIAQNNKKSYDLNHEMIETQIKYESAQKLVEEYKEKINELQKKIIQLEANRTKENKKG